jgi:hypothetical protein
MRYLCAGTDPVRATDGGARFQYMKQQLISVLQMA